MTYIFNVDVLNADFKQVGSVFYMDSIKEQFTDNLKDVDDAWDKTKNYKLNYHVIRYLVDYENNKINVRIILKDATEQDKKIVKYHLVTLAEDWTFWPDAAVQTFKIRIKKVI